MGEIFNAWRTLLLVSLVSRVAPDRRVHSRIERNFLVAQGHQGRFPFRYSLFESTTSCRENFFTSSFRLERVSRWITPFVDVSGENNTDARYTGVGTFYLSRFSPSYLTNIWRFEIIFFSSRRSLFLELRRVSRSNFSSRENKLFVYPTFTSNI